MASFRVLLLLVSLFLTVLGAPSGPYGHGKDHGDDHGKHHGEHHGKQHGDGLVVDLGYAKYRGQALASGVKQFVGMRFAAPPLGNLRFRAPQKPKKEEGIQDASEVGDNP